VVGAVGTPFGVFAQILNQGYVAVDGEKTFLSRLPA